MTHPTPQPPHTTHTPDNEQSARNIRHLNRPEPTTKDWAYAVACLISAPFMLIEFILGLVFGIIIVLVLNELIIQPVSQLIVRFLNG